MGVGRLSGDTARAWRAAAAHWAAVHPPASWAKPSSVSGVASLVSGATWSSDSAPASNSFAMAGSASSAAPVFAHSEPVRCETPSR